MKSLASVSCKQGFTFIDLLIVLVTVCLAGIILPALIPTRSCGAPRIRCVSNLKQVGLAMRMFSSDHDDKFPWLVAATNGGTLEYAASNSASVDFLTLSNELSFPKVLACPSDTSRKKATLFDTNFSNLNLSYFAGLDAAENDPTTLLSGDRNLTGGTFSNAVRTYLTQSNQAGWGPEMHVNSGNIALVDGSVQQMTPSGLNKQLQLLTNETIRLLIP